MAKRILIFSLTYYPRFIGGDGVAIKEITDRIQPSNVEFHMVTLRFDSTLPKEEKLGNVYIYRIGFARPSPTMADLKRFPLHYMKMLYQITAAMKAITLHRRYKYDAIWAMMAHSSGVPAVIFKLIHPNVGYALTLQEGDPPQYIERVMKPLWPLFSLSFKKADVIQTISTFLARWARKRGFEGPLEIIPNGFNPNVSHNYSDQELLTLKQQLGKKEGDIYLISVSRLVYKNAVDDIIRALPLLPAHVQLLVVGDGSDKDMLKKLSADLGVEKRVIFVGQVNQSETMKYRKVSDIFIRPSRSEGMGNSFISTMVAGLPVIATQEGGIADFLFDAERNPNKSTTGWAVDTNSPKQIAQAVKDILANPEKATQVVYAAREYVLERYSWDKIAKDMRERVFDRVLTVSRQKIH